MKLYDFHRHASVAGTAQGGAVLSFSLYEQAQICPGVYFSIGLHPWDSARADAAERVEKELPLLLALPRCLALGECGLDRLKGACMDVQQNLLARQLEVAENAKKPLVVHCVRAWSERYGKAASKGQRPCMGFAVVPPRSNSCWRMIGTYRWGWKPKGNSQKRRGRYPTTGYF